MPQKFFSGLDRAIEQDKRPICIFAGAAVIDILNSSHYRIEGAYPSIAVCIRHDKMTDCIIYRGIPVKPVNCSMIKWGSSITLCHDETDIIEACL